MREKTTADFVERFIYRLVIRPPKFGGRIFGELLHDSIQHTCEMSADISNVVELPVAAEEWPIDVVVLLRGAIGALASSY